MFTNRIAQEISPELIEAAYQEVLVTYRRDGVRLVNPDRCKAGRDILLDPRRWDWDGQTLEVYTAHGKRNPTVTHYYVDDECHDADAAEDVPCVFRQIWRDAEPDVYCKHRVARLILERAYELKLAQEIAETPASVAA